jgi:hypothetical protein
LDREFSTSASLRLSTSALILNGRHFFFIGFARNGGKSASPVEDESSEIGPWVPCVGSQFAIEGLVAPIVVLPKP